MFITYLGELSDMILGRTFVVYFLVRDNADELWPLLPLQRKEKTRVNDYERKQRKEIFTGNKHDLHFLHHLHHLL
jgi:hypothetical protein